MPPTVILGTFCPIYLDTLKIRDRGNSVWWWPLRLYVLDLVLKAFDSISKLLFVFVDDKEDQGCAAAIWQNDFEFFKIKKPAVIDLKLQFRTYVSKVYFKNTWYERDNPNPSRRFFRRIGKLPIGSTL